MKLQRSRVTLRGVLRCRVVSDKRWLGSLSDSFCTQNEQGRISSLSFADRIAGKQNFRNSVLSSQFG